MQTIQAKFMTPEYNKAVAQAVVQDIAARGEVIITEKSAQNGDSTYVETFVNGLKKQVTTYKGENIYYSYDADGNLLQENSPKHNIEYYYGKDGELGRSINTTNGSVSDYMYKDGNLTTVKTSLPFRKPTFADIENDEFGRVIKRDNKWEVVTCVYDDENRTVTKTIIPKNMHISNGKQRGKLPPVKETEVIVSTYDEYGRLVKSVMNDTFIHTYEYDGYIEKTDTFNNTKNKKSPFVKYTMISVTTADAI